MKLLPKVALGLGGLLVLIQVVRPDQSNPPVTGEIQAPAEVMSLLKRSCYDCHSNETKWPWYSQVAPVSWLVTKDVNDGRKHLNFSVWQGSEEGRKLKKFKEIAEEVGDGEMPMAIYLPLHPEAKLTPAETTLLVEWARRDGAPAP
ncbi:MAG: heme-binding domain-containing protein [Archangium sp.]|nr:heme-binding domain-containing protein [Archangium sp.]MDP3154668.1 heme-binding domain-containing protein [Archangium sp.]MDP3572704.1 heme-binding domain-containing protein [Archangium sp.]